MIETFDAIDQTDTCPYCDADYPRHDSWGGGPNYIVIGEKCKACGRSVVHLFEREVTMPDDKRTDPKFRVGQVVTMNSTRKQIPFKILEVVWMNGWFYRYDRKNCVHEGMIRSLTDEEK
jgi:hypothetical protein